MSGPNTAALRNESVSEASPGRPFAVPPRAQRSVAIFGDVILDQVPGTSARRATQTGLAVGLQALIIGALLLVPLLFTQKLDLGAFNSEFLVAPPPPAAPPPPPPVHEQAVVPKQPILVAKLTTPTVIPKHIDATPSEAPAVAPQISGVAGGVPGGIGGVIGGSLAAPAPPPPVPAKPKAPTRVFSGVKPPALLYTPPLAYPLIARENRVTGVVVIEAIIDKQGNVTQARVISGPGLLVRAALQAVLRRKYAPTILDGQPVSIRFDVKVAFSLSS